MAVAELIPKMKTLLAVAIVFIFSGSALAVVPGKTVEWDAKGSPGRVILDGKTHADKGLKCMDCHTKIFQMKKGTAKMKMPDINAGKFCGQCHDGVRAFRASDAASCKKCHKK
jgi:c(7)-type cytochrome triheme protein